MWFYLLYKLGSIRNTKMKIEEGELRLNAVDGAVNSVKLTEDVTRSCAAGPAPGPF